MLQKHCVNRFPKVYLILYRDVIITLYKVAGLIPGQLRVLDLDWSSIDDNDLATLANIPELRVRELSLAGCYNISSRGLADYCLQVGPKLLEGLVN